MLSAPKDSSEILTTEEKHKLIAPNGERLEGIGYTPDYKVEKGRDAMLTFLMQFEEISQDIFKSIPEERSIHTSAPREAKVGQTHERNCQAMKNDPNLIAALRELNEVTAVIPRFKKHQDISKTIQHKINLEQKKTH